MKYIRQFTLILLISFLGEVLHALLPLSIPAGIYGMALLFTGLSSGIISPCSVRETGRFLLDIMPLSFLPACVGLMDVWSSVASVWFPLTAITLITTVTVMIITGRTAQRVIRRKTSKEKLRHE